MSRPFIDAHHHLWNTQEHAHDWLSDPLPELLCGPHAAITGNYLVDDFLDSVGELECIATVVVEAGFDGAPSIEAEWIAETTKFTAVGTGIVAFARLDSATLDSDLQLLTEIENVRGVRHITAWHPDPGLRQCPVPNLMHNPEWRSGFGRLAGYGLSFDMQIYPRQVEEALQLIDEHPNTAVALEHTLMPADRRDGWFQRWQCSLRQLAARPQTVMKISGFGMLDHHWTRESVEPLFDTVLATFGPDRCMLGSNFPVDALHATYSEIWGSYFSLGTDLSLSEQDSLFVDSARRFYRLAS